MRQLPARRVLASLTEGVMQEQAAGLSQAELRAIVAYVAGRDAPAAPLAAAFCTDRSIGALSRTVSGWGLAAGSRRFQDAAATGIHAGNVSSLRLKWAFGLPGTRSARSQPVLAGNLLIVASTSGDLFALDVHSGCIKWHYASAVPLRTSLALGQVEDRTLVFVGDTGGFIQAVDAVSGTLRWRVQVGLFAASMLTGAPVVHGDRLVVPISSMEVGLARDPQHECCRTHGGVRMLDTGTGEILWTTRLAETATPRGVSAAGVQQWGPSGVTVWSTPTVDARRGLVYIGTGQNYSHPATAYSDAVLALDLDTGEVAWAFQGLAGDIWNMACTWRDPGPNCPEDAGPDHDFGAAVIIARTGSGKEILLAGQKSGEVFALDPDAGGKLLWQRRVGAGSPLGGVHWGMSAAEDRLFVPIADPAFSMPRYQPRPGLYALALEDGRELWAARPVAACALGEAVCRFHFRLSAAVTAVPGVVFAPGLDGQLRAFAAADGALLWSFDTAREFDTVNGVAAEGGSMDNAGAVAADSMLFVQSGYGGFGQLPGNVLLAFELD